MKFFFFLLLLAVILMPQAALAQQLTNPLGDGANTIEDILINISRSLIGLVAIGATFMFVYGGIMMLISGGNVDQVRKSKEVLKWTGISLVIIFLTGGILRFIGSLFNEEGRFEGIGGQLGLGDASLPEATLNIVNIAIGLLGITGLVMIIIGGYRWLTAAGNEQRVESAKKLLTAAAIGLIIILLAWAIVNFVIFTTAEVTQGSPPFEGPPPPP